MKSASSILSRPSTHAIGCNLRLSPTRHCKIGRQIGICLACTVLCFSILKRCLQQQEANRQCIPRPSSRGGERRALEETAARQNRHDGVAVELRPPSPAGRWRSPPLSFAPLSRISGVVEAMAAWRPWRISGGAEAMAAWRPWRSQR
jgi:hypothetical protein